MTSARRILSIAVTLLMICSLPARGQGPSEAQCREMVNGMLQSMKATPLEKERDRHSARALLERVEKTVRDNRARGIGECVTWAGLAKTLTTQ